jgi:hypothetical protein
MNGMAFAMIPIDLVEDTIATLSTGDEPLLGRDLK